MKFLAVRKIDEVGRIVLPMELRKALSLKTNSEVSICENDAGNIEIIVNQKFCALCKSCEDLLAVNQNYICKSCQISVRELF